VCKFDRPQTFKAKDVSVPGFRKTHFLKKPNPLGFYLILGFTGFLDSFI